jgi:hypothetical protein
MAVELLPLIGIGIHIPESPSKIIPSTYSRHTYIGTSMVVDFPLLSSFVWFNQDVIPFDLLPF